MKKTLTTITLAAILTLGSTFANAGIIIAGRADTPPCTQNEGIIIAGKAFVGALFGIIIAGRPAQCVETDGIIIAG